MVRYVKQKDDTSCGPIALINTLKWLGYKVSYDFIHVARYLCKWDGKNSEDGAGTTDKNLDSALKYFKIKKKRKVQPKLKEIDDHLDSGGAVIISYYNTYSMPGFKIDLGHYALCIGRTSQTYMMVNDICKKAKNKRYKDTMKAILRNEVDGDKCSVWLISK